MERDGELQGWVRIVWVQFFLLCDSRGVYLRGIWWCCGCLLGQGGGGWWQGLTSPSELPPKENKAVAPQRAASYSCLCWYCWGSAVLGDFGAAEAPVLTHLFLIGTSFSFCWIFF